MIINSLQKTYGNYAIDVGEGWRVYYTHENEQIVLLMIVGSKKTQINDIALVKEWLK